MDSLGMTMADIEYRCCVCADLTVATDSPPPAVVMATLPAAAAGTRAASADVRLYFLARRATAPPPGVATTGDDVGETQSTGNMSTALRRRLAGDSVLPTRRLYNTV